MTGRRRCICNRVGVGATAHTAACNFAAMVEPPPKRRWTLPFNVIDSTTVTSTEADR